MIEFASRNLRDEALKQLRILIVDDHEVNVALLEELLRGAGYAKLRGTTDPRRVQELCVTFRPDLLLLDLHMPGLDGFEVMSLLQSAIVEGPPLTLIFTADVSLEARRRAFLLGARDFLTKPLDSAEVLIRVHNLLETRYLQLQLQDENKLLSQRIAKRTNELERARRELLDRLALAAEYRDYSTAEHTQRVGRTAGLLAQKLGVSAQMTEMLIEAAPLHDIGKLGVSDAILLKPGPLDSGELELMRRHVQIGAEILSASQSPVLRLAEEIALSHHERWDGAGYAAGVRGEDIPLPGRITAIADVFDALTHERPYKPSLPVDFAIAEIEVQAGRQFDPVLVQAFMELDHASLI